MMAREGTSTAKSRTAPAAYHPRKPDTPADLTKPSWTYTFKKAFTEFGRDQCTDLAAALTYYAVLALFPALLALVSLLGVFGQGESTTSAMLDMIRQIGQGNAADQLRGPISQMTQANSAGFALVFGLLGALWSASGYVGAFGRAMNRVYQIDEGRPVWKLRPLQLLITLVGVLLVALVLVGLVVSGPVARAVGEAVGLGDAAVTVWNIAKWPVMLLIVVVLVALLYYATPNIRQPKFRWISIGAAIAIVTWVIASAAFGFYVSNFGNYNKTYGSLAGVIVFLLWLWLTNLALLFGAEVDAELERSRQLQAGIKAEETLQLPPRDTRASDKKAEKLQDRIAEGRELRERAQREQGRDRDGGERTDKG
jgi:membrane protein